MKNISQDYFAWFKELEAKLNNEKVEYVPHCFYGLIKWYYNQGHSAEATAQQIKLHISVLRQQ